MIILIITATILNAFDIFLQIQLQFIVSFTT